MLVFTGGNMRFFFSILMTFILSTNLFSEAKTINLRKYEKSIYSQNGEDGVLEKIFSLLGTKKGYCVEFSAMDGLVWSNTLNLRNQNWKCLLMSTGDENLEINLHKECVTPENIEELFKKYGVPKDFDLVSIDIDSMDWYVWRALGKQYRPKVVLIEYNQYFGNKLDYVVAYDPFFIWDNKSMYFGASLEAYYLLGKDLGYTLVYVENQGVNAFFIRDDLLEYHKLKFLNQDNVQKLFRGTPHMHAMLILKHYDYRHAADLLVQD